MYFVCIVNNPTLLAHDSHRSLLEGWASCFYNALSIHNLGITRRGKDLLPQAVNGKHNNWAATVIKTDIYRLY